jgi:hypothetical protein
MQHRLETKVGNLFSTVKLVDAHSLPGRKMSAAAKACDAADALDGLITLVNPTLRLVAFAWGISVSYVVAAHPLTPAQRDEVRKEWRPLIWPRLTADDVPALPSQLAADDIAALPSPQERFVDIVNEIGLAGALDQLAEIERTNGNGAAILDKQQA